MKIIINADDLGMSVAVNNAIAEVLSKQDKIMIPGFGGFSSKKRSERKGRNPSTGKEILIPETVVASFKSAAQLKEFINS